MQNVDCTNSKDPCVRYELISLPKSARILEYNHQVYDIHLVCKIRLFRNLAMIRLFREFADFRVKYLKCKSTFENPNILAIETRRIISYIFRGTISDWCQLEHTDEFPETQTM